MFIHFAVLTPIIEFEKVQISAVENIGDKEVKLKRMSLNQNFLRIT